MFFEVRCGDMFAGRRFEVLSRWPREGDVLRIGSVVFRVWQITPRRDEGPLVDLCVVRRAVR